MSRFEGERKNSSEFAIFLIFDLRHSSKIHMHLVQFLFQAMVRTPHILNLLIMQNLILKSEQLKCHSKIHKTKEIRWCIPYIPWYGVTVYAGDCWI